jgi:hypothetical protein
MDREPEPRLALRSAAVAGRSFGDETIILDLRESLYLSTNPAGTLLWRLLESSTTRSEMVDALQAEFAVDRGRAGTDVDAFVADCRRRQLLDETAAPGSG